MARENLAQALRRSADEPALFGEVYEDLFDRVLAYHARRILDEEVALDLTAESFAQGLSRPRPLPGDHPIRGRGMDLPDCPEAIDEVPETREARTQGPEATRHPGPADDRGRP